MTAAPDSIFLGSMSGTSLDGLDLVAVRFDEDRPNLLHENYYPYPDELRQQLLYAIQQTDLPVDEACRLDTRLGHFYADRVNDFIDAKRLDRAYIAALGSHGQTLRHAPLDRQPHTLQIGDPNIIAALTGITVVADFRRRDLAHQGQGAPLAPAFHQQVFRSSSIDRAVINIGGIANITHLPSDPALPVLGFDSGPGNTLLDRVSELTLNQPFDRDGAMASSGQIDHAALRAMLQGESFFRQTAPKSTGTDHFSIEWLESYRINRLQAADALATLVELTVVTIYDALRSLDSPAMEYYVCGGGAHNRFLIERLQRHLGSQVQTTDALGIHPDWVEAMAFAWLARQTLSGLPGNLPSVTNADCSTILGAVFFSNRLL